MPKFSMPAFVITDLLARGRHVGRRVALMDSLIAGAAGSVTFGIILGALSKPRQRASSPIAPVLWITPTVEGSDSVALLTWSTTLGAATYNVNRTSGSTKTQPATGLEYPGFYDDDLDSGTSYTYSVDAIDSKGNLLVSSVAVTITALDTD